MEQVADGTYRRGLRLPHGGAEVALTPLPGHVAATLRLTDLRDLAPAVARCRRLLDLDADPAAVDATLAADPALAARITADPGVRVPRSVDGFEMAVRAIVGQQISVAGARTVLARLTAAATTRTDLPTGPAADGAEPAGAEPAGGRRCGRSRRRRRCWNCRIRRSECRPPAGRASGRRPGRSPTGTCTSTRAPTATRPSPG
ncbi:hypothetical protein GCM10027605_64100 [Micromonospora zhanjiangensis]